LSTQQMAGQQTIDKYVQSPRSPLLPRGPFNNLKDNWSPNKPHVLRNLESNPIPSTSVWTEKELLFFNLHYYNVVTRLWSTYFCPDAQLTVGAKTIVDTTLDFEEILHGTYFNLPHPMPTYGEIIFNTMTTDVTEAATDDLVLFLLRICNPSFGLFPQGHRKESKIKVGTCQFISIPDVSVRGRPDHLQAGTPCVIVVENKQTGNGYAEYQLPGEMLAAAMTNYSRIGTPQTIFAMRFIGTQVTFYRADFPESYLASVAAGSPTVDITIFRLGGTDLSNDCGIKLSKDKVQILQFICNMMAACTEMEKETREGKISAITKDRISVLY